MQATNKDDDDDDDVRLFMQTFNGNLQRPVRKCYVFDTF